MSKKLLLADDSITIQKVIAITFANEDYDLIVVDNGDAALATARNSRPDLILADVFMPGKNGYELCRAVKEDPSLQGVPVLLLTGTFEPFDEAKAAAAGADGWVAKPFESQTLIDRVEELLAKPAVEIPNVPLVQQPQPAAAAVEAASAGETEEDIFAVGDEDEVATDLWEELAEPEAAAGAAPSEPAAEEPFGEDELWGEVSFDEEELDAVSEAEAPGKAESAEQSVSDEAFWESLEEPLTTEAAPAAGGPVAVELEASADEFAFEEEPARPADEALWEALEEPLPEAAAEPEESFIFEEEEEEVSAAPSQPTAMGEDAWLAEEDEDILTLDESDILEEEALELEGELWSPPAAESEPVVASPADVLVAEESPALAAEDAFEFADAFADEPVPAEEEPAVAPIESFAELLAEEPAAEEPFLAEEEAFALEEPFAEEEDAFSLEDAFAEESEAAASAEPAAEPFAEEPAVEDEEIFGFTEPLAEVAADEPIVAAEPAAEVAGFEGPFATPLTEAPAAGEAAVAAQAGGLSDEELASIVEKVAGTVIERLAGTILERIAWEVVPDLAESMIREEIRQIKERV